MGKIPMNDVFKYIRPDKVAETWEGVSKVPGLYETLWSKTEQYKEIDRENCGPHDVIGINALNCWWNTFSNDHKRELNRLAELNNRR